MWASLAYHLRAALPRAGALLAGWKLSIVLLLLAALYDVLLAIWARSSPPHVVRNIAALAPFWVVWLGLLANTVWCLWRRLPGLRRDLARGERAPLGTYLFHGALLVLALGFGTTMLFREELKAWAAEGEEFAGAPEQWLSRASPRPLSRGAPPLRFEVRSITPELWRDQLLFTELSADLALPGGERATTRINRPLWLGFGTFLRLSGFGYAPRYELTDARGRVVDGAFVKMNVFPPGMADFIRPERLPYRIRVEVLPDLAFEGDRPVTRTLNLVNPGFRVHVWRGKVDVGGAVLRRGEPFAMEGLVLRFPEIRYWGEFSVLRDPGAPILLLGLLLGLAGLLLKLWARRGAAPGGQP